MLPSLNEKLLQHFISRMGPLASTLLNLKAGRGRTRKCTLQNARKIFTKARRHAQRKPTEELRMQMNFSLIFNKNVYTYPSLKSFSLVKIFYNIVEQAYVWTMKTYLQYLSFLLQKGNCIKFSQNKSLRKFACPSNDLDDVHAWQHFHYM